MTMGNDMSALFPDVMNCMQIPVLEIKKMVYLYLIIYSRSKPDMAVMAIPTLTKVSYCIYFLKEFKNQLNNVLSNLNLGCRRSKSIDKSISNKNNGIY